MRLRISLPATIVALSLCIGVHSMFCAAKASVDARTDGPELRNHAITGSQLHQHHRQLQRWRLQWSQRAIRFPVTGTYNVWAIENIFYFVPGQKFLGATVGGMILFPTGATGSLDADISNPNFPNLSAAAGGGGIADLYIQPIGLGWHLKRADL